MPKSLWTRTALGALTWISALFVADAATAGDGLHGHGGAILRWAMRSREELAGRYRALRDERIWLGRAAPANSRESRHAQLYACRPPHRSHLREGRLRPLEHAVRRAAKTLSALRRFACTSVWRVDLRSDGMIEGSSPVRASERLPRSERTPRTLQLVWSSMRSKGPAANDGGRHLTSPGLGNNTFPPGAPGSANTGPCSRPPGRMTRS